MSKDLEEVRGKAMWFLGIKKRVVQAGGPSRVKTHSRKCACCAHRIGRRTIWLEGMNSIMVEDEVKEVVEGRADHVRFEGRGKESGFYSNGRKSEGFEQSNDMFRLMLKRVILGAMWRIGYVGLRAVRPIGRFGPRW